MAHLFLHGGDVSSINEDTVMFYLRAVDLVKTTKVNIAHIVFAGYDASNNNNNMSHRRFVQGVKSSPMHYYLQLLNPHKRIESEVLPANTIQFVGGISKADIIFVWGGDGDLLQKMIFDLISIEDLKYLVSKKIIMGVSAGTNMWSKLYYSNDNQRICKGLDIFPLATFCHYNSFKFHKLNQLIKATPEGVPVIPISSNEFVYMEVK